jgi:Rhs element Vgr protein
MAKILQEHDGLIDFDVSINGARLKDTVEVCEIFVQREVNRIALATIEIVDGGPIGILNEPFTNSESKDFIPGNEIEIRLGYGDKREEVFKGIITAQRLMVKQGKSRLVITCKDKAVKMTKGRFNAFFQEEKDSDALKKIVGKYGLQLHMDDTATVQPVLVQYNCSDWDFLMIRAELNNMCVLTNNNILSIKKLDFTTDAAFEINTAQFVIDIDLSLNSENITDNYHLTAWNDKQQRENTVTVKIDDGLSQGNLSVKNLSEVLDSSVLNQYSAASLSEDELKMWGTTLAGKAVLSKIQGSITVPGTTDIKAGDLINISGYSQRFNGKAYISKVTHELKDGSWVTQVFIGSAPKWHSTFEDVEAVPASGLIPSANGIQIGKVKKITEDPAGNYRILVNLPTFSGPGQADGLWARLALPYASADAGFFFFPEIDAEVLVTFVNNDPRYPVITGALYSSKNKPKEVPDDKNQFKSIYSKSGISIRFDDENKILALETPGGNSFLLDDKEKRITLKDRSGNSLIMDDSGITLDSIKDIKLSAKGDVEILASGGIDLKANSDVKVDGANVALNAKIGFTAKGNATAEISASGQTTVKGAMVMIN